MSDLCGVIIVYCGKRLHDVGFYYYEQTLISLNNTKYIPYRNSRAQLWLYVYRQTSNISPNNRP